MLVLLFPSLDSWSHSHYRNIWTDVPGFPQAHYWSSMESLCRQAKDWSTFVITHPSQTQDNHLLQKGFNGIGQAVGLSGTDLEKFSQVIKLQLSILFMFIRSWWSYSHRTSHYLYQAWTWRYVPSYMSRGCQTTLRASGAALRFS